jgi:hypothetical protein
MCSFRRPNIPRSRVLSQISLAKARRRWIVPTLTVAIAIGVVSLIIYKRLWVHQGVHEPLQRRAAELTAALMANGLNVGEPQRADAVPGVEQVVVVDVGGRPIRLLEFDMSNDAQAKEVRHIHGAHSTTALGVEQPAEVEGAIAIIDFDKHPDKKTILDAFHSSASKEKP